MKYIKTAQENGTMEVFIFPITIDHDKMADSLGVIRDRDGSRVSRKPVSAGFYDSHNGCTGRSETLNKDSQAGDTELVERQMSGGV